MRKTACVTGGSGYIASALIKTLLEKGYAVKTTVRNPDDAEKNSHLKDLQALGPLEVFCADLDEEGSFDQAVAGCDYAFLVAAPAIPHLNDPENEVIEAAARGALNVMRSCIKAGTVKRVVLTSSASAVSSRPLQGDDRHVLLEDSWADVDFLTANKPADWAYTVSRVLMEKEACRFAQERGIDLVTVCPVVTVGKAPAAARKIPAGVPAFLSLISGDEAAFCALKRMEIGTGGGLPLVHIDDVCCAEVFVAEEGAAAGRYICCSINATVIVMAHYLDQFPQFTVKTELISGSGGDLLVTKPRVCLSSAKLVREGFDFKYNLPEEIYDDMIGYGKATGILPSQLN